MDCLLDVNLFHGIRTVNVDHIYEIVHDVRIFIDSPEQLVELVDGVVKFESEKLIK